MADRKIQPGRGEGPEKPPEPMIEVPSDLPPGYWEEATRFQFIYSLGGQILGLGCIVGGIALFWLGVTGSTSWTVKILGAESKLLEAAPGAVLFVVGLFLVWVTRFAVKTRRG